MDGTKFSKILNVTEIDVKSPSLDSNRSCNERIVHTSCGSMDSWQLRQIFISKPKLWTSSSGAKLFVHPHEGLTGYC